jgi:hypothetical protein
MNEQQQASAPRRAAGSGEWVRAEHEPKRDDDAPYIPRRYVTARDETLRAGEHRPYQSGRDRSESELLPMLAVGAGALVAGWLLGSVRTSVGRHRSGEKWPEETPTARRQAVAKDETHDLIASNKVEGTAVYGRDGERLGSVYNFMVGKRSGQVAYAVMSFGGWLGMGERYHPLPWDALTYDTDLGGYVVGLTKERLRNAPSHSSDQNTTFDDAYWRQVRNYWS